MPDAGTLEDGKDKEGSLLSKKSEVYSIRRFCFTLYASVYFYELNARCRACSLNLLEPAATTGYPQKPLHRVLWDPFSNSSKIALTIKQLDAFKHKRH
jgi:hypothetical protein